MASSKVLVTNLHNLTQPIIRYELTDRFTPAGISEGGALRASVEGRSDDLFRYAEARVHPFVIGAPLLHDPAVREFQVRQTERGADIAAVIDGDFDSGRAGGRRRAEAARGGRGPPGGRRAPGRDARPRSHDQQDQAVRAAASPATPAAARTSGATSSWRVISGGRPAGSRVPRRPPTRS